MKAVGATALGGATVAGTASAWENFSVHFCGCGQVVVKGEDVQGPYTVTVYEEGRDGGVAEIDQPAPSDPNFLRFVQKGRGKILAITFDGTTWCNPNECAQKLISQSGIDCDTTGQKGHCGPPNDGNG